MGAVRGLLDTSVVIAEEAGELPLEAAISVATLAELHFGIHLAKTAEARTSRLRRLAAIESHFTALAIDEEIARAYGELATLTATTGRKVRTRTFDILIAATAYVHRVPLFTRDLADFRPLVGKIDLRSV